LFECTKGRSNLSASQFKNLVGRICRFKELFHPDIGSLNMLEPEIYIVASGHMAANANIENFIRDRVKVDKKINDNLENVLLKATPITELNQKEMDKANEILENLEPGITDSNKDLYARTTLGQICYNNNITEFNILEHEQEISAFLAEVSVSENKIISTKRLLDVIHIAFISFLPEGSHRNIKRLAQDSAKRFYAMLIEWRIRNASFKEMIGRFLDYWKQVDDPLVYVDKWGDTARPDSFTNHWVDVSEKTGKERVNLAIVRIKEEQDFLDNNILKFVEVLNDMELLEEDFYTKIKYGTTNKQKITMIKNGFSAGLSSLLIEKYSSFLKIDIEANTVELIQGVEELMTQNGENSIYTFEAGFYTG